MLFRSEARCAAQLDGGRAIAAGPRTVGGVPPAPHRCQFPCRRSVPCAQDACSGTRARRTARRKTCSTHDLPRKRATWSSARRPRSWLVSWYVEETSVNSDDRRWDASKDWWPHRRSGSLRSYHAVPDLDSALTRPRSLEDARVHILQDQAEMEGGWASGLDEERKVYQIVRKNTQTTCLFGDRRQRADGAGAYTRVSECEMR